MESTSSRRKQAAEKAYSNYMKSGTAATLDQAEMNQNGSYS